MFENYTVPRVLHVLLKLRDETRESDQEIVDALRDLRGFTHISLVVPAWEEAPDAARHPLVVQALRICRERAIGRFWTRRLWPTFGIISTLRPRTLTRAFDATYYAGTLAVVHTEAAQLGVIGSGLDAEAYGPADHPDQQVLKGVVLSEPDQAAMRAAITLATARVAPADLIYPCSSSAAWSYTWLMGMLGRCCCCEKLYYLHTTDAKLPTITPPAGMTHRVHLWGSAIGTGGPAASEKKVPLLPREFMGLDLARARERFPECLGFFGWCEYNDLANIIRALPGNVGVSNALPASPSAGSAAVLAAPPDNRGLQPA